MQLLVADNASSALAFPISLTDTTCTLQAGTGVLFPNPLPGQYFAITFITSRQTNPLLITPEIVYVTGRSGDTITSMMRGQEGTTAQAFLAGDFAWCQFTAGAAQAFPQLSAFNDINPNGFAAGVAASDWGAASLVFSIPNKTLWICTLGGDSSSAVWAPISGQFRLRVTTSVFHVYVATTGNDANDGLTPTTPFATLQRAWSYMTTSIDANGNTIKCSVADGTYGQSIFASGNVLGQGDATTVVFEGNIAHPENCVLTGDGLNDIFRAYNAVFSIVGFTLQNPTAPTGNCIGSEFNSTLYFNHLIFGTCVDNHLFSVTNGVIVAGQPGTHTFGSGISANGGGAVYVIQGGAQNHKLAFFDGLISVFSSSITIFGNPTFSSAFAHAELNSNIQDFLNNYVGSATGVRWIAASTSTIYTNGEPPTYLPGSAVGVASTGGQYI